MCIKFFLLHVLLLLVTHILSEIQEDWQRPSVFVVHGFQSSQKSHYEHMFIVWYQSMDWIALHS